jgi:thymidylate synthase ThyX
MIKVEIVADSLAPSGHRLTTFVLTYPRFIHSEFMTHRMFSRNASSSRAIPVSRQIQMIKDNPAIPLAFRKNQKGMQAGEQLDNQADAIAAWLEGRDKAVEIAEKFIKMDVHKQYANRVLEPYAHITVVCSATDFANFFALRIHSAAQPEICELAKQMWEAYKKSEPEEMIENEMHLPFISRKEINKMINNSSIVDRHLTLLKMSVARCARVSYLNHEGKTPTMEEDLKLYDRLLGSTPVHASPAEHQAWALTDPNTHSGNFRGWEQYRKTLKGENIVKFTEPSEDQSL